LAALDRQKLPLLAAQPDFGGSPQINTDDLDLVGLTWITVDLPGFLSCGPVRFHSL
jgi:hypothetical protein